MKYEKLFQPGKIGNLELRNRVVMTAMGALMGDWNGCTTPEQIRFYEDRAKGGCGLIIPEFTSVDADSGHCNPIQLGIYDSRQIKSFQLICEAVHRHGAKIFIQLHQTNGDHIVDFQFIITVLAVLNMLKETFQLLICQFLFNKSRNHPLYIMTLHPRFPLSSVW